MFGEQDEPAPVSWAAIVKGSAGVGPDLTVKRDAIARQIRENNGKRARDKREAEERKQAELAEQERVRVANEDERQMAIAGAQEQGHTVANTEQGTGDDEHIMELDDIEENQLLVKAVENPIIEEIILPQLLPRSDGDVQGNSEAGVQRGGQEGGDLGVVTAMCTSAKG